MRGIIAVDLGGRQGWWGGDDDPARGTKEMEAKAVPCPLKYYCSTGNFQPRSKLSIYLNYEIIVSQDFDMYHKGEPRFCSITAQSKEHGA